MHNIFIRLIAALLFTAVLVLGVWTFAYTGGWEIDTEHGWWLPEVVTDYGEKVDDLFILIMWLLALFFVATEGVLIYCVLFFSGSRKKKSTFTHGNHKLEIAWTFVPAVLLLAIALYQMSDWAHIKFDSGRPKVAPIARVWAAQFDWHMQYPGEDGIFDTQDDIDSPYEFVVPVGTDIVFDLRSRDVIHSFFVPEFRLKQDAMPGMVIPVWFNATKIGEYDLICAELCGWGHYKMAGRVKVVSQEDFEAFLKEANAKHFDNGSEDRS